VALAEAEKSRVQLAAEAQAEATRRLGEAEAQVIRMRGQAEAEILRQKGEAEAKAMDVKAQAYRGYTQAAVLDKLLSGLPEMVRAVSEPLGRVDKITVVSTGDGANGASAGVNRLTADVAKVVAQVPALVESLAGISLGELIRNLPRLGATARATEPASPPETAAIVDKAGDGSRKS
jgi:flotillin